MFEPLTVHRREFLARALMDVVKFAAGSMLVTGLFGKFSFGQQFLAIGLMFGLFVLAWVLFPPKGAK